MSSNSSTTASQALPNTLNDLFCGSADISGNVVCFTAIAEVFTGTTPATIVATISSAIVTTTVTPSPPVTTSTVCGPAAGGAEVCYTVNNENAVAVTTQYFAATLKVQPSAQAAHTAKGVCGDACLAAAVVGSVFLTAALAGCVWFWRWRKQRQREGNPAEESQELMVNDGASTITMQTLVTRHGKSEMQRKIRTYHLTPLQETTEGESDA